MTLTIGLIVWYCSFSVLTFIVYVLDKTAARKDLSRTPESTLHLLALLGGWPGALVAQQVVRHKTGKTRFQLVFALTVIANCALFAYLLTQVMHP
jgi:uncharacterized membrane protein YsdA (DUF1294 family)